MCNEKVLKIDEKYFNINIYFLRENDQNTFSLEVPWPKIPIPKYAILNTHQMEYQDDTPH